MDPRFTALRYMRIALLTSCACCLALSLAFAIHTEFFLHNSTRVAGEVVALKERYDSKSESIQYAPVFRFAASDGKAYTIASKISTDPASFAVGDTIEVLYRQNDPQTARINSFWQMWLVSTVLVCIGVALGLLGWVLLIFEHRRNQLMQQIGGAP
jgi:hypothetical protein